MKRIKHFWGNLPRRVKIAINLLALFLLGFALYIFIGCPAFTPEQRFRRLEKKHMVGPARIIENYELVPYNYLNLILADDGDGVIFYPYADFRHGSEGFYYREKTGDLTVLAAPVLDHFSYWEYELELPIFLFDNYPKAQRAQLQFTLSETVNDVYFEKEYILDSVREEAGLFRFVIHAESENRHMDDWGRTQGTPLEAEGTVLQQFSHMCGYDDSFNLRPQIVTVRLWDAKDKLILEEEILVHCVAGQAHTEQGEVIPPKEHKKAAG